LANTKAAQKAMRVATRRQDINKQTQSKVKTIVKIARQETTKSPEKAVEQVKLAQRAVDIASKSNVIHRNKASRIKSRLMKKVNKTK